MKPSTINARIPSPILKQKGTVGEPKADPAEAKLRGVLVLDGPTPHHLFGNTPIRKGIRSGWEGAPSGESRRGAALRTCLSKEVFPPDPASTSLCGDFAKTHDALSRLSGGLTSSSIEYAMTGSTKLNLAQIHGTGVLELNIGDSNNIFNLGTGGTDLSYGTLSSAYKGIGAYAQNRKIREAGVDRELRAAARTLYSAGMDETDALYADILNGDAKLNIVSGKGYEGYTELGSDGKRNISLNSDGKSALDLSVLLAHEAFRDGQNSGEFGQLVETRSAVKGHMNVASALQSGYGANYLNDGNNREAMLYNYHKVGLISDQMLNDYADKRYSSEDDYWRIVLDENGKVQDVFDDGDKQTLIFVDENGETQTIRRVEGSLSGQIAAIAAGFQTGEKKQSKSDINSIMMKSGLDYDKGKGGWYAETDAAKYHGSGYDPVYAAIGNGNYGYLDNLGRNSETDISQEMVEEALGLKEHSACAITASAEYANNYFQEKYGVSLGPDELIDVLRNAQGEMFNDDSEVLSYNGLNAMIGDKLGIENYPVFETTYESYDDLQAAGVDSYMQKYIHENIKDKTHFVSSSHGSYDDPYTTYQRNKWWEIEDMYSTVFYDFKSKY